MPKVFGGMAPPSPKVRPVLLALALLSAQLASCLALLSGPEQSAVLQLLDAFPSLSTVKPTAQWDRSAIANICDYPNAFECVGGHIQSISIDDTWGSPIRDEFDAFSGLTALSSLKISPLSYPTMLASISTLIKQLSEMPSLAHLVLGNFVPVSNNAIASLLANVTSLQDLSVTVLFPTIPFDFSRMTSLQTLTIGYSAPSGSLNLGASLNTVSNTSLIELRLGGPIPDFGALSRFGNLETLEFPLSGTNNFSFTYLASSLRSLIINNIPNSIPSLDFSSLTSNLKTLSLRNGGLQSVTAWPPAVETISITGMASFLDFNGTVPGALPPTVSVFSLFSLAALTQIPTGFFAAPVSAGNLTSIQISLMPAFRLLPTDLALATSLDSVTLFQTGVVSQELCRLPTTLRHISVAFVSSGAVLPFPTCFASFTYLQEVTLANIGTAPTNASLNLPPSITRLSFSSVTPAGGVSTYNWPLFVQSFPNLTYLQLSDCGISGTFPSEIQALTQLETLNLAGNHLTGTIDPGFFASLNTSTYIDLSRNTLSGTIPNQFAPTLQRLHLNSNSFDSFGDPLLPAPSLHLLRLSGNLLTSLPSDEGWAQFPNLEVLSLQSNPQLASTPVPTFWSNHSSLLFVDLSICGFSGTLPSEIVSPLLRTLDVSNNQLCGSLPALQPLATFVSLSFRGNSFSGTIPPSFFNVSLEALDLSNNRLTGNLSELAAFTSSPTNQLSLTSLVLNDNDFFGSLPDMSKMAGLRLFTVDNTLVELCTANPSLPSTISSCGASNLPNGGSCACKSWYASCTRTASSCTPTVPFVPHSTGPTSFSSCGTVSIAIPTFATCDYSTQPSPVFSCINGVWTATESVTAPIVVSSPIVIVSGNLSAPVTITNPSSSIIVKECVSSNTTIEIVLTPSQIEALRKNATSKLVLSQLGLNCTDSASNIHVSASISGKTCKKVSVSSDVGKSDHSSLFVVFKIGTSQCNIWWIVLASVLGGLVVAGIVAFVLLFKVKSLRKRFMPATLYPRASSAQ